MNITEAKRHITRWMDVGEVPCLIGSPGTAKSAIIHEIAAERKLLVIDLRLSQCDPTDLQGFPTRTVDGTRMEWVPPAEIPLEGDEIPTGYEGWLLFLDEITSANQSMQASSYKVVHDRKVGQRKLHPACYIAAAGNRDTDRAATHRMSTALINRMVRAEVEIELEEWINNFALPKGLDFRVLAFLRFQPDQFYAFDPSSPDPAYPSARSWEKACKLLATSTNQGKLESFEVESIGGAVGQAAAVSLNGFLDLYAALPDPDQIVLDPENAPVPEEPGQLYAVSSLLPRKMTLANAVSVLKYVSRLPVEFQMVVMHDATKTKPELKMEPSFIKWLAANSRELFS